MCISTVFITLLSIIILSCFLLISVGWYLRRDTFQCLSDKRLDGKTVLVTGGSSGIGLEVAMDMARRGAKTIITSDKINEGEKAKDAIQESTLNQQVLFQYLDFSSLECVRRFVAMILETEERLDILINNAGVILPDVKTIDGMNFIMQVNYFGPFLLTLLLLPLLKKTGKPYEPSRIVNTSSLAHSVGTVNFDKINSVGHYKSLFSIYSNSKLCVAMFTRELAKRLKDSDVVVNTSDPKLGATNIIMNRSYVWRILSTVLSPYYPSAKQAAQTTLHVALDQKAAEVSGEYFYKCKQSKTGSNVYDTKTSEKLWNVSVRLVKLGDGEYQQIFSESKE